MVVTQLLSDLGVEVEDSPGPLLPAEGGRWYAVSWERMNAPSQGRGLGRGGLL